MKKVIYPGLLLLCLLLYLPGQMSLPPFDRDEARFAQASHQMVETGNYVDIHFQDEVRYKKPIGIYWLQAASAKLTGAADQIWAYRVPSWIGASLAVLLTALLMGTLFSPSVGVAAALVLSSCLLMGVESRMAKTDAVQLAAILGAQFILARLWLSQTTIRGSALLPPLLFWGAVGIGVLVKGPIILLVTGLTAVSLSLGARRMAWLRPLLCWQGGLLFAAIVLPWLIAITIKSGGQFWVDSVGKDLLAKAAGGQESHGAPPGYYLGTVFLTFWPWAPLLLPAGVMAWNRRREPSFQFLFAWALPVWLVFELMPTKLLHYTLPVFPVLSALVALLLIEGRTQAPKWLWATSLAFAGVLLGVVALAVPLAPTAAFVGLSPTPTLDVASLRQAPFSALGLAAGLGLIAASAVMLHFASRRPLWAAGVILAALVNFYAAAFSVVLPETNPLWVSRSAAELVAPYRVACAGPIAALGYGEPSLVFLLGTDTRLLQGWDDVTRGGSCQLVLVEQHFLDTLPQPFQTDVERLGSVSGFNYSKGDPVVLTLLKINPVETPRVEP